MFSDRSVLSQPVGSFVLGFNSSASVPTGLSAPVPEQLQPGRRILTGFGLGLTRLHKVRYLPCQQQLPVQRHVLSHADDSAEFHSPGAHGSGVSHQYRKRNVGDHRKLYEASEPKISRSLIGSSTRQ